MPGHVSCLSILLADAVILVQLECPFFFLWFCKSIQYCVLHNREGFTVSSELGWHRTLCCISPHSCCPPASCGGAMSFKVAWTESQKMKTCLSMFQANVCVWKTHTNKNCSEIEYDLKSFLKLIFTFPKSGKLLVLSCLILQKHTGLAFYQQLSLMHLKMPLFCLYSVMALHSLDLHIWKKHQE